MSCFSRMTSLSFILGALQRGLGEFVNSALTEAAGVHEAEEIVKQEREVIEEVRRLEWQLKEQRPDDTRKTADSHQVRQGVRVESSCQVLHSRTATLCNKLRATA